MVLHMGSAACSRAVMSESNLGAVRRAEGSKAVDRIPPPKVSFTAKIKNLARDAVERLMLERRRRAALGAGAVIAAMERVAAFLSSCDAETRREYILNNFDLLKTCSSANSGGGCARDVELAKSLTVDKIRHDSRTRCRYCREPLNIRKPTDIFVYCQTCDKIIERDILEPGGAHSSAGTERSGASTGLANARPRSIYSTTGHFNDFLNRLCAINIPRFSTGVYQHIEKQLEERGFDLESADKDQRLADQLFWRSFLKSASTPEVPLHTYFHHIPYLSHYYSGKRPTLLTARDRAWLQGCFSIVRGAFRDIAWQCRETRTRPGKKPRRNMWSFGTICALILNLYGTKRHRAILADNSSTLRGAYGYSVRASDLTAGAHLINILINNEDEIIRLRRM